MNIFAKFESENKLDVIRDKIVKLAKDLLLDCDIDEELLDEELGELTNEELIEEKVAEEEKREPEEEKPQWMFTEGFSQLNKALAHFETIDPNIE